MAAEHDFHAQPLGSTVAVGRVTERSARIWVRSARAGPLIARLRKLGGSAATRDGTSQVMPDEKADHTVAFDVPSDLDPHTTYECEISHQDGPVIGTARFTTNPSPDSHSDGSFRIGIYSCHQPFDLQGRIRPDGTRMLQAMLDHFEPNPPVAFFEMGDQMYVDAPDGLSLFDDNHFAAVAPRGRSNILECDPAEVRQLLNRRYRLFWNMPEWQRLHERFPCYPIWDDHEMIDNWGSAPEHQEPNWQAFREGGRAAYFDYQGSRVLSRSADGTLPGNFHYTWEYGPMAAFVMDLRSERTAGDEGRLISPEQMKAFETFLQTHEDKGLLLIVFSVPIIHLPGPFARWAARITPFVEDFSDRWSTGPHIRDRNRVLELLHRYQDAHPHQRVVLLSGDIHIGCLHAIHFTDGGLPIHQFISSGVTHASSGAVQWASKALIRMNRRVHIGDQQLDGRIRLVRGVTHHADNPCGGLNCGVLEAKFSSPSETPRLRFELLTEREGRLHLAFQSPWL